MQKSVSEQQIQGNKQSQPPHRKTFPKKEAASKTQDILSKEDLCAYSFFAPFFAIL
jgi:hypothetical protein